MKQVCGHWLWEDVAELEKTLTLRNGRDRSVRFRHPWIFASAIDEINGEPEPGETLLVKAANGEALGRASYSPGSQIRARMLTFDADEEVDERFFQGRIKAAIDLRKECIPSGVTNAMRIVHGESDGLPGLIVDRYDQMLVVQILTAGMERNREMIFDLLMQMTKAQGIYERSDVDVRTLEGLPERVGLARGKWNESAIEIFENGLRFNVDIAGGQKTGFFLDQRDNRKAIQPYVHQKSVLNCFCYTGAFSVYALDSGAQKVLSIDSSGAALEGLKQNVALNGQDQSRSEVMNADIFKVLRTFRDQARKFDVIILDPPKFAPTVAQAEKAARGYKDINLLAFKLLNPGGTLFTFSCSGGISRDLFQKIVASAALDAKLDARIVGQLSQAPDHPVGIHFPEGFYLKGLICKV
ncbi:MAG TPA: 23S rRNA (cytosine(1962)-C(5))-methyltransferase RlmI [Anaerolineaceae bacterium]|nr:23S rRNA (cytosine(1962)-C(5))-methyltransferase RlmI [Anaerolineaceae bacterium]